MAAMGVCAYVLIDYLFPFSPAESNEEDLFKAASPAPKAKHEEEDEEEVVSVLIPKGGI